MLLEDAGRLLLLQNERCRQFKKKKRKNALKAVPLLSQVCQHGVTVLVQHVCAVCSSYKDIFTCSVRAQPCDYEMKRKYAVCMSYDCQNTARSIACRLPTAGGSGWGGSILWIRDANEEYN